MQGLLFDLDGVIYNTEEPIDGAAETIAWVQRENIPHLFVTNTTSRGRTELTEKLQRFGIDAGRDRILTPCSAAADWLRDHAQGPAALFVPPAAYEEFHGIPILDENAETGARFVIVGDMGKLWDFSSLNRAFRLLHSGDDVSLIALGMTRYWVARNGVRLDAGPFIAALEYASGKKPVVFGKPAAAFFQTALDTLELPASETVMIGDDIVTDIAGAQRAGLKGILVRTGKYRPADLAGQTTPDTILPSVRDVPGWWETMRHSN
jgi:phospholysine phosphohistidine inorganic pyrophosphate phosphatase